MYFRIVLGAVVLSLISVSATAGNNVFNYNMGNSSKLNIPANSPVSLPSESAVEDEPESSGYSLEMVDGVYVAKLNGEVSPLASCANYIALGLGQGQDGVYQTTHSGGLPLYCDMTTDGGGWSLVVAQFESSPVLWSGDMSQYDPSLVSQRGFALPTIPSHSQVGLSQTSIDGLAVSYYGDFVYSTGDIPVTNMQDQTGRQLLVHRDERRYFFYHDPENELSSSTDSPSRNALVFDYIGETGSDGLWIFSPHLASNARGYAYKMATLRTKVDGAWVLYVR